MDSIKELQEEIAQFSKERDWDQFHTRQSGEEYFNRGGRAVGMLPVGREKFRSDRGGRRAFRRDELLPANGDRVKS